MRKIMAFAAIIVFAGAGCVSTTQVSTDTTAGDQAASGTVLTGSGLDVGPADVQVNTDANVNVDVTPALNVSLDAGNFYFKPNTITAKPGQIVNVKITGVSGFHTFVIDAIKLKKQVTAGETITFTAPTTAGSYEFYCDVASHRSMGMTGTLTVSE